MTGEDEKRDEDQLADDVDDWTAEPKDPDHGGPPAEFMDVPENTPPTGDDG